MNPLRSISPTAHRCSGHDVSRRPFLISTTAILVAPRDEYGSHGEVLHCLPPQKDRGGPLEFHTFDQAYVERLRAGDYRTQEHFRVYFTALIQVKLRSRLRSPEGIEDVRQETFARFYVALREGKIQRPERLGPFVNSICNNVLQEHYRAAGKHGPADDEAQDESPSPAPDPLAVYSSRETQDKVRKVLDQLPERDRRLLREVLLEERDKDEVCRDFGVDREYLRVLLHRAKKLFKSLYLRNNDAPEFTHA
jgi:RNA polymerase sigma-70 factor, ECF subfamily